MTGIENWTQKTSKGSYLAIETIIKIGLVATAFLILLVFVSAFSRYLLRAPVPGSYELVEQTMNIVGGLAIFYAAVKRGHLAIDLIITRLSKHTQVIMQRIFSWIGFGTWAVVAYPVYVDMVEAIQESRSTLSLGVTVVPFLLILLIGLVLCSLTSLIQAFRPEVSEITGEKKRENQGGEGVKSQ